MGSKRYSRIATPLTIAALALTPTAGAIAPKDYSKNGATGDYAPQTVHKNYALNGATGDYTPAVSNATARTIPAAHEQSSFAWGDAALGAGSMLVVVMLGSLTLLRVRRRRIAAPSPARPSAA